MVDGTIGTAVVNTHVRLRGAGIPRSRSQVIRLKKCKASTPTIILVGEYKLIAGCRIVHRRAVRHQSPRSVGWAAVWSLMMFTTCELRGPPWHCEGSTTFKTQNSGETYTAQEVCIVGSRSAVFTDQPFGWLQVFVCDLGVFGPSCGADDESVGFKYDGLSCSKLLLGLMWTGSLMYMEFHRYRGSEGMFF